MTGACCGNRQHRSSVHSTDEQGPIIVKARTGNADLPELFLNPKPKRMYIVASTCEILCAGTRDLQTTAPVVWSPEPSAATSCCTPPTISRSLPSPPSANRKSRCSNTHLAAYSLLPRAVRFDASQ